MTALLAQLYGTLLVYYRQLLNVLTSCSWESRCRHCSGLEGACRRLFLILCLLMRKISSSSAYKLTQVHVPRLLSSWTIHMLRGRFPSPQAHHLHTILAVGFKNCRQLWIVEDKEVMNLCLFKGHYFLCPTHLFSLYLVV